MFYVEVTWTTSRSSTLTDFCHLIDKGVAILLGKHNQVIILTISPQRQQCQIKKCGGRRAGRCTQTVTVYETRKQKSKFDFTHQFHTRNEHKSNTEILLQKNIKLREIVVGGVGGRWNKIDCKKQKKNCTSWWAIKKSAWFWPTMVTLNEILYWYESQYCMTFWSNEILHLLSIKG